MNKKSTEKKDLLSSTTLFSNTSAKVGCEEMEPNKFTNKKSLRTKYMVEGNPWKSLIKNYDQVRLNSNNIEFISFIKGGHNVLCSKG